MNVRSDPHRDPRRAAGRALFALTLTLLLIFASALASVARAGTYLMNSCNVPGAPAAPLAPWYWEAAANVTPVDSCAQGAGFVFYFGGPLSMPRGAASALTLSLPASGPISIRRVRLWTVGRLSGGGSALFAGTNSGAPDGQNTNSDLYGPVDGDTLTTPHVTSLLPLGTNVFRVLLYCSQSSPDDCFPSSRTVLEIVGAEVTLLESVAPTVSVTGGSLGDGPQSATRTVKFTAVDNQSGVEAIELLVDNAVAAKRDYSADCPHADYAACAKQRSDEIAVDTSALANGSHRVRLRATDAAGNAADSSTQVIEVANQGAGPAGGGASSEPPRRLGGRLTAAFAATPKRTMTVSYRGRPRVVGRLTDVDGRPVAKAAISVTEKVAGRPPASRVVGETRDDGRYAIRLAARGSSRVVRVEFVSGGASLSAPALRLRVRAAASLKVALNGVRVRYRGAVVSQQIPRRGLIVVLQGRRKGGIWQSFATRRVSRSARFTGTYRLRVRRPGVVLQFRAVVSKAPGYPYETGFSAVVARTVR